MLSTPARLRIDLFSTCSNDTLFPQTGRAAVEVLERLGQEVVFPEEQTCCGQMDLIPAITRRRSG